MCIPCSHGYYKTSTYIFNQYLPIPKDTVQQKSTVYLQSFLGPSDTFLGLHIDIACAAHGYHMHTTRVADANHMGITCTPHVYHMHTTWVSQPQGITNRWIHFNEYLPIPADTAQQKLTVYLQSFLRLSDTFLGLLVGLVLVVFF